MLKGILNSVASPSSSQTAKTILNKIGDGIRQPHRDEKDNNKIKDFDKLTSALAKALNQVINYDAYKKLDSAQKNIINSEIAGQLLKKSKLCNNGIRYFFLRDGDAILFDEIREKTYGIIFDLDWEIDFGRKILPTKSLSRLSFPVALFLDHNALCESIATLISTKYHAILTQSGLWSINTGIARGDYLSQTMGLANNGLFSISHSALAKIVGDYCVEEAPKKIPTSTLEMKP